MRLSTTMPADPSGRHHMKHWSHRSAYWTGQKRYADSASATYGTARGGRSPSRAWSRTVSMIAAARASSCTRGRATLRS
eukprot:1336540-Pleurochrysis_carterae.AAC.1